MIPEKTDMVNHPPHYKSANGIECIDAIEAAVEGLDAFAGYCVGNAMKYIWRHNKKGKPVEDISKAIWYLNKLAEKYK